MKNAIVAETCEKIYNDLTTKDGYDVLFDDRNDVSAGFKFNDADLLGMPIQVIVGEKNLKNGNIELKNRKTGNKKVVPLTELSNQLQEPF
jgi:prolyl-tRNA synthetase